MARLQILELPEGNSDDRPPFVLVVDQVDGDAAEAIANAGLTTAELIGARAVLVFEDTIDIPANDTTAYLSEIGDSRPEFVVELGGQDLQGAIGTRLAHEWTDIARDMDRLAKRRDELADALGMDRTRDWDDIRNAAAGLRKQRDDQAAELERLRAGEEPVTDTAMRPTSGQWIWQWNRAAPEKRLNMAAQILGGMAKADDCFMADHEAQIANLRAEVEQLRTERSTAETPDA